ncbi:hypothetical protein GJAV_G00059690 [Gymnothorax javanicus]|nr:hypothetical protein GJAV_G00059690 [Gymnothorax javanicus]
MPLGPCADANLAFFTTSFTSLILGGLMSNYLSWDCTTAGFDIFEVNFFLFIRIIQILVSKLKARQMRYTDYKFRLAKSTLTLIPLLGIHEVVFAVMTEEKMEGTLRNVSLFFELFLNSFQGFLVAILYCFVNKEVQSEIKRKWQRWRLGMSVLDEQRNTGSNTPQGDAGQLPQDHHSHQGFKEGQTFCYISAHKQVPNGTEDQQQGSSRDKNFAVQYSESSC